MSSSKIHRILGRRKSVLLAILIVLIAGFSAALSNSYWMFVIFRIFIAFGSAGALQASDILSKNYSSKVDDLLK
jgi:MFS family permease